jgi:hypothetical protein
MDRDMTAPCEAGVKMEVDRLGFIHENYFYGDFTSKLPKHSKIL